MTPNHMENELKGMKEDRKISKLQSSSGMIDQIQSHDIDKSSGQK
jgi:hypothetical protein